MAHGGTSAGADPIARALERAAGILPDQGPIGVFIHHNTLHAFQHLPFHEGVQAGAAALGARPYLELDQFRAHVRSGRIAEADVLVEIDAALGDRGREPVLPGLTRRRLWLTLLTADCEAEDAPGLTYTLRRGTAPVCADLPLFDACRARVSGGPGFTPVDDRPVRRHRDVLLALGADDTDVTVHAELIRIGSRFLDQGQAYIPMPARALGFLRAARAHYTEGTSPSLACAGLTDDLRAVKDGTSATVVIRDVLESLGVRGGDVEPFLLATALALPGWAGMFSRLERHPEEHHEVGHPTLAEFLAVRLLVERSAVRRQCRERNLDLDWAALRQRLPAPEPRDPILDAHVLWWLARAAALPAAAVAALTVDDLRRVWTECAACPPLTRRQLFQDAYERTYRQTILDALAARRALPADTASVPPRAQFVFCIDEREESIRRAIEEQRADYLTYGVAGFFGLAIDYQGLYDREPAAHCPVVVTPAHEVHERPIYTHRKWHRLRNRLRDQWHDWERHTVRTSRTLSGGAWTSFLVGPVAGIKTLAHVVAPRSISALGNRVIATIAPRPDTRLSSFNTGDSASQETGHKPIGFSLTESVDRVTGTLRNIGLVREFAPIVVVIGHGSTSLNNPHESAHDCGACGGRRGGANARLFAEVANRPDVREGVRQRGIDIPAETWFIGALHDTADDSVTCYDLELLPPSHAAAFDDAWRALDRARRDSAQERCRRFDNAPLTVTPDDALRHVEGRSAHLAQPRPEYGHCTNAICIVGRRSLTRGLHLDRRAFLVSYDPTVDAGDAVLERILAAVGPVGAGISLEYYFSSVDNEVFGCGTKLPHNVTGLVGVMNGHQSDLRTGLPLQMVELHEPMRLLLIVDATEEALAGIASRQPEVAELVGNAWVQLVAVHPETGAMSVFDRGAFVPYVPRPALLPVVDRSAEWHMRSRDHLPPALVRRALPESAVGPRHHAAAALHV
jgi:uncharacterized protein YbcC (UPF0753/DUF2309 family)